jgi:acyl-CoA synthetase (AMP-forming)/AMP-acid ligase II
MWKQMIGDVAVSPLNLDIPVTDVASYVFSSGDAISRKAPQYFDAANPVRHYSLEEAEVMVKRFAKGLQALGLQPDDKVLLFSANGLFSTIAIWGTLAARCVFTGVSPSASTFGKSCHINVTVPTIQHLLCSIYLRISIELSYQLKDSEAKVLLTSADGIEVALKAAAKAGMTAEQVYLFNDPLDANSATSGYSEVKPWTDIWAPEEGIWKWEWYRITNQEEAASTTAVINYSSG